MDRQIQIRRASNGWVILVEDTVASKMAATLSETLGDLKGLLEWEGLGGLAKVADLIPPEEGKQYELVAQNADQVIRLLTPILASWDTEEAKEGG